MFIKRLEMENWKCFKNKTTFEFKEHELISKPNGRGKSSMFQAINFAINGKPPVGFNLNTVRNDPNKPCRIFISLDIMLNNDLKEMTIERIFGTSSPLSELKINGELICESVRTIEAYMDKIINQKIMSQIWTNSLIESDITSSNFFTKSVLEDILKDPLSLQNIYKGRIFANNRRINSFNENILDVEALKEKLENIKKNLKEKSDGGNINLAKSSKDADEKLKVLRTKLNSIFEEIDEETGENIVKYTEDEISQEMCRQYLQLAPSKKRIEKELEAELKKNNSIYSSLNQREFKKIIAISEEMGSCILCGGNFNERHREHLLEEMKLSGRSEEKIEMYKEQLKFINSLTDDCVKTIMEINSLKNIVSKCPDYEEIIESYNEENNKLWAEFDRIQKQYGLALKQQEELKEINALKETVRDQKEKLNVINEYLEKASAYYTNQIMEKASEYLSNINNRYKQICLYENNFNVVVEDESHVLNLLPVARLSSGEKTMCALSLLFSIHNLLVPELPLLFDETFASLDRENLEQVQKFLHKQRNTQIFVITHDKNWEEF